MSNTRKSQGVIIGMIVLLGLSAGINALQTHRIRSLTTATTVSALIGQAAEPIEGYGPDGQSVVVTLRNPVPTVVYFFSPTCAWCRENWPNIAALRAGANGRYRVLAISSARGLRPILESAAPGIDAVEGISENTLRALRLTRTPRTLVVSTDGLITHDWLGAYTPRMERQIEDLFGVALPGVHPAALVAAPAR
jgi:hypothetical protein